MKKGLDFVLSIFLSILFLLITLNSFPLAWGNGSLKEINWDDEKTVPKPLLKIISVEMDSVPFEKALFVVAKKGGFKLNYSSTRLKVQKRITLKMKNVTAIRVLQKILDGTGAELRINKGGHLVIVPRKRKMSRYGAIYGKVEESSIKRVIPGIQIQIIDTKISTVS
ncbi:STN domain-containing protein, partial [Candidatus Pacearchaeota archaeon]|nr:STN domain-containing protein [Candidatus Pacearchaeota archaeon]